MRIRKLIACVQRRTRDVMQFRALGRWRLRGVSVWIDPHFPQAVSIPVLRSPLERRELDKLVADVLEVLSRVHIPEPVGQPFATHDCERVEGLGLLQRVQPP